MGRLHGFCLASAMVGAVRTTLFPWSSEENGACHRSLSVHLLHSIRELHKHGLMKLTSTTFNLSESEILLLLLSSCPLMLI